MKFEILFQDEFIVAIFKPGGYHVHQPEPPRPRAPAHLVCLAQLRDQINCWVYPVHRLDVATSGVLLYAKEKESARLMCEIFSEGNVVKDYFAIVRGYTPDEGEITLPLKSDSSNELVEAKTKYRTLAKVELPFAIGKRHQSSRYSFVQARPFTGRFHQIRRHLAQISHPIVGDGAHGDSHHNRFFREKLAIAGLQLIAKKIKFVHPKTGSQLMIECPWPTTWVSTIETMGMPGELLLPK